MRLFQTNVFNFIFVVFCIAEPNTAHFDCRFTAVHALNLLNFDRFKLKLYLLEILEELKAYLCLHFQNDMFR